MAQVYYVKPDELYHYGILGMKWGVRRYQNPDGTLTAAGKKRYDKAAATMNELSGSKQKTDEKEKAKADSKPKSVRDQAREMSDEDLKKAVDRLTKEKQYTTLMKDLNPPQEHFFQDTLKKNLKSGFEEVSKSIIKDLMLKGANSMMKSMANADSKDTKSVSSESAKNKSGQSQKTSGKSNQSQKSSNNNDQSQNTSNGSSQKQASKDNFGFSGSKKEPSSAYEAAAMAMMFPVSSPTEIPDLSYILDMFK